MSLARKLLAGSGLSFFDQALKIASAFFLTPIIVNALGAGPYGAWCVIIAVFAQYGWLDLGLGVSMPRFFAKAVGRKDVGEIQSLASTGKAIFLLVAAASLAITTVVAWQSPAWFASSGAGPDVRTVVAVFGSFLAVQTLCQLQLGYLKGHLRYDLIATASICRVLLSGILFYVFLTHGHGLLSIAVIQAGCGVMESLLLVLFARGLQPPLRPLLSHFQKQKAVEVMKYSAVAYLMMAGLNLRNTLDPIIIAARAGEDAVTGYALGNRFPVLFVDIAHILAGGQLLSLFSRYIGEGDQEGLRKAFLFASKVCAAIAVYGSALMWMFGLSFLQRWIPAQADAAWQVMIAAILPKALYIAQTPSMVLLLALAQHRRLAWIDWAAGACNVCMTWWLAGRMGAPGAAWATCIEQSLVCGILWPLLSAKAAGMGFGEAWRRLLAWPIARSTLILAPCALLMFYARPDYLNLIAIGFACTVWFVAGSMLTMNVEERIWMARLMPLMRRFAPNRQR
jgi:O-antigen/teichoic acid export membrane protein